VVLVDLRGEPDIERVLFPLALRRERGSVVLLLPAGDSKARVRELCKRHEVDAWLALEADGLVGSLDVVDLIIGRTAWAELALAAAAGAAVDWFGDAPASPGSLSAALRELKVLGEVTGVLQLGAGVDLRLADRGGIAARGTALREHLIGNARAFLEALSGLRPRETAPSGAAAWEAVGPHADRKAPKERATVEAREPGEGADRASRIEAELDALKARMRAQAEE